MPIRALFGKSLPVGLLGAFLLVASVERRVAKKEAAFTTIGAAAWKTAGDEARKAAGCDVLAFGDSLVKHGVAPRVLEGRAGVRARACNLAMTAGMAAGDFFLLRRALEAGSRPRAVLVDGEKLGEDPLDKGRLWADLATFSECAELARAARSPAFLARMVLSKAIPSYKARLEIQEAVRLALDGKSRSDPETLFMLTRNWRRNGGAHVLPARVDPPGADPRRDELAKVDYRPSGWRCHPLNDQFIRRYLDLAETRGVSVFWLLPPYHPEVQSRRERHGWDGGYMSYLRALAARYPNLTVVDGRHAGYGPELLADFTHLSRPGAIVFSDAVATVIQNRLATTTAGSHARWVEIPVYRDGDEERVAARLEVEDVDETIKVIDRRIAELKRAKGLSTLEERRR